MLKSVLTEYGLPWVVNRTLYALKLKTLNIFPRTEKLYEKPVTIKRINIFDLNIESIENFLTTSKMKLSALQIKLLRGKSKLFLLLS